MTNKPKIMKQIVCIDYIVLIKIVENKRNILIYNNQSFLESKVFSTKLTDLPNTETLLKKANSTFSSSVAESTVRRKPLNENIFFYCKHVMR